MITKQQIQEKINKLQNQLKEIEETEKLKDFKDYKVNGREIRIYKWENKPMKDFVMPKCFDWCDYKMFIDLVNQEELKKYPIYYYMKNPIKKAIENSYPLLGCYLGRGSGLNSDSEDFADSYSDCRVVVMEITQ